jgi:hypothetical protein
MRFKDTPLIEATREDAMADFKAAWMRDSLNGAPSLKKKDG